MLDIYIEFDIRWDPATHQAIQQQIRGMQTVRHVTSLSSSSNGTVFYAELVDDADVEMIASTIRSLPGVKEAKVISSIQAVPDTKHSTPVKLEVHPSGVANYNERAEQLLEELTLVESRVAAASGFMPDFPYATHFPKESIGSYVESTADYFGNEWAKHFEHQGEMIGLAGEGYQKYVALCEKVHSTPAVRRHVSSGTFRELVFDLLRSRYQQTTSSPMMEYVLQECEQRIRTFEIWIPVFGLFVETEIPIGTVTIKTIPKRLFEDAREAVLKAQYLNEENVLRGLEAEQRDLESKTAAVVRITAEQKRAFEVAYEQTEMALTLLRFFSMANLMPGAVSYCMPVGREHIDSYRYLLAHESTLLAGNGALNNTSPLWTLDKDHIYAMRRGCLDAMSRLVTLENKSPFEKDLLNALFLYLRHTTAKDLSDKLLYIFTALDAFLLRDKTENIQQNIGQRIAMIAGKTVEERRSIIDNVKKAYELRSNFVHHGKKVGEKADHTQILQTFLHTIYRFFVILVGNSSVFKTREQMLDDIEARMLSG